MKKEKIFVLLVFCLLFTNGAFGDDMPRVKSSFNNDWKFILDDNIKYRESDYNDSNWRSVQLPHDWSIEHTFSKENNGSNAWLPGGKGWYRKRFVIDKSDKGKNFEIQFDGIYRHSRVWVNGVFIGVQYNGYTSFNLDITEALNYGGENVIAVSVDNSVQPNCRWYSGSGIYRNVWLIKTEKEHIRNWGTYITASDVSSESARINIKTTIDNFNSKGDEMELESVILDKDRKVVSSVSSTLSVGALQGRDVDQSLIVRTPHLWSVDSPYLYSCVSTLKKNNKVVDRYESAFGVRRIDFDPAKGFFLNGKNMKMKGVCLHHDGGAFGAAVPVQIWERRLSELKKMGCNAIRTSHNPPAPEFLDLCDKIGFLVMEEFDDKWNYLDCEPDYYAAKFANPFFHVEWEKNYRETIRRDRNHPSIVLWSVGNENHKPGSKNENVGLKRYCCFVRDMDNTRPVISGMPRSQDMAVDTIVDGIINSCSFMDVIAMNYGEQWTDKIHEQCKWKPYVSTESYTYYSSSPEQRWANREYNSWLYVMKDQFNMGLFLWVGINYLGESKKKEMSGSSNGLFDMAGFETPRAGLFKAFWSDEPVVRINVYDEEKVNVNGKDTYVFPPSGRWGCPAMSRKWNLENGRHCDLVTYTNCEEVDLYLNNHKIGSKKLSDYPNWIMKWKDVLYKKGTLRAVGKIGGKPVCEDIIKSSGQACEVSIRQKFIPKFTSDDVIQLEIELYDRKGNKVLDDDRMLHVDVDGDAKVIALTNGNPTTDECLVQTSKKATFNGKMLCVIKRGSREGNVKVSVWGDNIKKRCINL